MQFENGMVGSQKTIFLQIVIDWFPIHTITNSSLLPLPDSLASHVTEEEEEEDGEYNFLADCLREEEREEFRNDRAVRIPRNDCLSKTCCR